jgi:biopolymer transport protein ExbB/TolQ
MNSFSAIAVANDTSLRVVAPGIAEALSATALGLVAAIPAVVAYNKLAVSLNRIAARFTAGIEELARQFTRRPDQAVQQWRAAE